MDHFFVQKEDVSRARLVLRNDESKHLARVLRKKVGDRIVVTDGANTLYEAQVVRIGRDDTECDILEARSGVNEPRLQVTLAFSLLKNPARIDFLVEKAVELGVHTIVPMLSERTIPHREKQARLQKIALAAMKQSERCYLPKVAELVRFEDVVGRAETNAVRLIPHEKTGNDQFIRSVMERQKDAESVLLVIGPEGGFTDEEVKLASSHQFIPVSLGPRRLRTETAAIVALNWILAGQ